MWVRVDWAEACARRIDRLLEALCGEPEASRLLRDEVVLAACDLMRREFGMPAVSPGLVFDDAPSLEILRWDLWNVLADDFGQPRLPRSAAGQLSHIRTVEDLATLFADETNRRSDH